MLIVRKRLGGVHLTESAKSLMGKPRGLLPPPRVGVGVGLVGGLVGWRRGAARA